MMPEFIRMIRYSGTALKVHVCRHA